MLKLITNKSLDCTVSGTRCYKVRDWTDSDFDKIIITSSKVSNYNPVYAITYPMLKRYDDTNNYQSEATTNHTLIKTILKKLHILYEEPPCRSHVCLLLLMHAVGFSRSPVTRTRSRGVPQSRCTVTVRPLHPRHPSRPTTPSPTHKTGEAVANYATRSSVYVGVAM